MNHNRTDGCGPKVLRIFSWNFLLERRSRGRAMEKYSRIVP